MAYARNRRGRRRFGRGRNRFNNRSKPLNIQAFIKKSQQQISQAVDQVEHKVERDFNAFKLNQQLQHNLKSLGFSQPTPIQDQTIEAVLQGRNVLGIANTGTGKTGAFLIPLVSRLTENTDKKVLIVAPTRELAIQINKTFMELTRNMRLYSVQCIGGTNINNQIRNLKRPHNAVIGTPGRIIDLERRNKLDLSQFEVVVLDEVDRMLDMGFINDIKKLLSRTPANRQSLYFSATLSDRIQNLINKFSDQLHKVSVKTQETADLVIQKTLTYKDQNHKLDLLHDLLISDEVNKTLVFGKTKRGVKKLMFQLRDRGFRTDSIHGNKSQSQRQQALNAFRKNHVSVLVATDVAARGLDIDDISHVINFELPDTYDDYVHRIGRTGRAGKKGVALTFVR